MSAIIISLNEAQKIKSQKLLEADFDTLIKEVARNIKKTKQHVLKGLAVISLPQSKDYFAATLQETVINREMVSQATVLCALYISDLLYRTISSVPDSLYATDYLMNGLEQKSGKLLCAGGDLCFMFCTVFNERCHWRQMSKKSYTDIGQSLYHAGYGKTGCGVHYLMGQHFTEMTEITNEALTRL